MKRLFRLSSLGLTALLLSVQSSTLANPTAIAALQQSGVLVGKNAATGKVNVIGGGTSAGVRLSGAYLNQPGNPPAQAQNFLRGYAPLFGVANPDTDLKPIKSAKIDNSPIVRYQQVYRGVPVFGGQLNVNLTPEGNLRAISGEVAPNIKVDTNSQVSATQALKTALGVVQKHYKLSSSNLTASTPQLQIYNPSLIRQGEDHNQLVWFVNVKTKNISPINQYVLVSAERANSVVLSFDNSPDARNRQTYNANNTDTLPGTLVCNETNATANCSATGASDSAKAHTYAADTYNFYATNHGRDSIDGYGMPIISTVNYSPDGFPYENAFWDGNQMVYGAGFTKADDVVGHELTHGVTQYTSNLFYYYQSGAINESFSDIWGEFIDLSNAKGNDTATVRWQLGEDLPSSIGVIRDMKNPPAYQQPDKMTSTLYFKGSEDQGGVHYNSGIGNKAAYLMTDGGTFNGKTITGIGITKVAKIFYRVQTTLLTSGSDYNDLYNYLNQSCTSLIGTSGITSTDCLQVKNAALAVEMNKRPTLNFMPVASVCPVGKTPQNAFLDDVEGSNKWNFLNLKGYNPWRIETGYSTSGTNLLYAEDADFTSDSVAIMKQAVTIPTGAFLHFKHSFGFEYAGSSNYDGAVLEYSVGTTGTWRDAKALFAEGQNYNGTISTTDGSPIKGRSAFTKDSHGYVSTRYNLSTLAGKQVRFRLRQANDPSIGAFGWAVDDFRIYTCP